MRRRHRIAFQDGVEDYRRGVARKRQLSGGHLINHSPQREKIGAGIELFAPSLLRRHVRDSADRAARVGKAGGARTVVLRDINCLGGHSRCARELGEAEVQNLHLAPLGKENVRRLDVAMDDSFRVCGIDRVRQLNAHVEQTINRQRSAVQFGIESLTLD